MVCRSPSFDASVFGLKPLKVPCQTLVTYHGTCTYHKRRVLLVCLGELFQRVVATLLVERLFAAQCVLEALALRFFSIYARNRDIVDIRRGEDGLTFLGEPQ